MLREASNEFKAAVNPVSAEVSCHKCLYSAPLFPPLQDTSELCMGSALQRLGCWLRGVTNEADGHGAMLASLKLGGGLRASSEKLMKAFP